MIVVVLERKESLMNNKMELHAATSWYRGTRFTECVAG